MLLITAVMSIAAQSTRKVDLFTLDLAAVGRGEVWRLLTHQLVWSTSGELVLGSVLLYTWRMFERQFGARKFGACVVFLHVMATVVQVAALAVGRSVSPSQWAFSSGPYALLFGLLSVFFFDIPQSAPFTLFGLPLSDKLFLYVLSLQVCLAHLPGSAYTALIGLVLGALYRIEALPFHRLRIPAAVSGACSAVFKPILSGSLLRTLAGVPQAGAAGGGRFVGGGHALGSGPASAGAPAVARQGPGGYQAVGGDDAAAGGVDGDMPQGEILNDAYAPMMAPAAVDPQALQTVMAMGFSEPRARAALMASQNNVPAATHILLGS